MANKPLAGVCFVLAGMLFVGVFFLEKQLERQKPAFRTAVAVDADELPPSVKLINSLLGSFRTLLVDFFWIRADALQREGRYFAASELARWITLLQSRVEDGWNFQAWNLAYNIPSDLPYDERWPYIQSALKLLWDKGLKANPGSISMHDQIARLWFMKIGGDVDPASELYRRETFEMTERILGPKPWNMDEYIEAAEVRSLLLREQVVKEFLNELKQAGVKEPLEDWVDVWSAPEDYFGGQREWAEALRRQLSHEGILRALDRSLRAEAWKNTFGFSMKIVKKAMDRYTWIGLGTPEGMTICWCTRGLSLLEEGRIRLDAIGLWRMRFRALRRLFRVGRLELAEKIDADYRDFLALLQQDSLHRSQGDDLAVEWTTFLRDAVPLLFINGSRKSALALYRSLKARAPELTGDFSVDDFAFYALSHYFTPGEAERLELLNIVRALLVRSLWRFSSGDEDEARIYMTFVKDMHNQLVVDYAYIPPFEELLREARTQVVELRRERMRSR